MRGRRLGSGGEYKDERNKRDREKVMVQDDEKGTSFREINFCQSRASRLGPNDKLVSVLEM